MTKGEIFGTITAIGSLIVAVIAVIFNKRQIKIAEEQTDIARRQLEQANIEVRDQKQQIEKTRELFSEEDEYLENIYHVFDKAEKIIKEEYKIDGEIDITNLGLDLETVVPWFNKLIENSSYDNILVRYRGLIINPEAEELKHLIDDGSNIKTSIVNSSLENIQELKSSGYKGIDIEIRSYKWPPLFHGFIIDKKHLFLSFTEINNKKMNGGKFPYIYIKVNQTSKMNKHLFNMFSSWFNLIWDSSEQKIKFSI